MSELLVIARDNEEAAFELRDTLQNFQKQGLFRAEDIVVVTREDDGAVRLHQMRNTTAMGAVGGAVWGALLGLVFMSPVIGAAIGAGTGAVAGHATDLGINDDFMREAGTNLPQGGAAVFMLIPKAGAEPLMAQLQTLGHTDAMIKRSDLHPDFRDRLAKTLAAGGATTLAGEELTAGAAGKSGDIVGGSVR
ncbi:DUF1269 domain-containing protein [Thioclava sp.]|uniref:DUF1269 domain-containing protein n=1 Tax=Thioclava sp. TaxID=1933450 RepID=UPI003AA8B5F5